MAGRRRERPSIGTLMRDIHRAMEAAFDRERADDAIHELELAVRRSVERGAFEERYAVEVARPVGGITLPVLFTVTWPRPQDSWSSGGPFVRVELANEPDEAAVAVHVRDAFRNQTTGPDAIWQALTEENDADLNDWLDATGIDDRLTAMPKKSFTNGLRRVYLWDE